MLRSLISRLNLGFSIINALFFVLNMMYGKAESAALHFGVAILCYLAYISSEPKVKEEKEDDL